MDMPKASSRKRKGYDESRTGKKYRVYMALEDEPTTKEESRRNRYSDNAYKSSREAFEEGDVSKKARMPSKNESELHRFLQVKRKEDFIGLERIDRKLVNVLEGLELHTGVFDAYEQKAIVDFIHDLQDMGWKQKLRARTFSAPRKWMRGKGRQTIQFGCCYNYATDKHGNPPGILKRGMVDPLPPLFKSDY